MRLTRCPVLDKEEAVLHGDLMHEVAELLGAQPRSKVLGSQGFPNQPHLRQMQAKLVDRLPI